MRVALYARVSTEEQVKKGLSIDTQLANLRAWAKENGHSVIGEYVDAGVSARKNPAKRPELQRLLGDLDKVDLIAFTKLDRWTRNIKGYYDVQAILDEHKVAWAAIQEDYETLTATGRFKVNIMLSVAENEADRTSERIKVVLDRKVAMGEYIGNRVPLGLQLDGKHFVPGEDADIVRGAFELYRQTGSIYRVKDYVHERGYPIVYVTVCRILRNGMYAGRYRDNYNYCEPIIDPALFDEVQEMLKKRSVRHNKSQRVYIFSGLLRCAYCGKAMIGSWLGQTKDKYRYRCNYHYLNGNCPNSKMLRESTIEQRLLDNVVAELTKVTADLISPKKKKRGPDKAAIMAKVERLQELYVEGMIDKQKFMTDREKLLAQIPQDEPQTQTASTARRLVLSDDFRQVYDDMPREDKRSLWRSIIDHIMIDDRGNMSIYFLP